MSYDIPIQRNEPTGDCRGVDQCDEGIHCAHVQIAEQCCYCGRTWSDVLADETEGTR